MYTYNKISMINMNILW